MGFMRADVRVCRKDRADMIIEDICPICGGELDTGFECNDCEYDAGDELEKYLELVSQGYSDKSRA